MKICSSMILTCFFCMTSNADPITDLITLGDKQIQKKQTMQAGQSYQQAHDLALAKIPTEPQNLNLMAQLSRSYIGLYKYDSAQVILDRGLAINPNHSQLLFVKSQLSQNIGDLIGARSYAKQSALASARHFQAFELTALLSAQQYNWLDFCSFGIYAMLHMQNNSELLKQFENLTIKLVKIKADNSYDITLPPAMGGEFNTPINSLLSKIASLQATDPNARKFLMGGSNNFFLSKALENTITALGSQIDHNALYPFFAEVQQKNFIKIMTLYILRNRNKAELAKWNALDPKQKKDFIAWITKE